MLKIKQAIYNYLGCHYILNSASIVIDGIYKGVIEQTV